jgi:Spy/CpxP family protein refolding chaperone
MKRTFILSFIIAMLAGAMTSHAAENWQNDWKQKMLSEKVAFLTIELGITPEEAQVFWPVYNEVNKERDEAMHKVFKTYRELEEAVQAGKETSKLLDAYLDALDDQREVEKKAADKYRKVLSEEKLAKLYIGEEKFRRQHIRKLHDGNGRPAPRR